MFWLIPVIAVGGAIMYISNKVIDSQENEKKDKVKKDLSKYNYKKSDLPSKIRFWDDIKKAEASGKWKDGAMPSEFRYYEKFNDKTKKWERIDKNEFIAIEYWGSKDWTGDGSISDKDGYSYYLHKKPRGREGKYFISYFTSPAKPFNYFTKGMKDTKKGK